MDTKIDWEAPFIAELMKNRTDGELAEYLGVTRQRVHQVRKRLGLESYTVRRRKGVIESGLLGVVTDEEVEHQTCEDRKYVASVRQSLGIKSYRKSKFDKYEHLLGTISDKKLAEMVGTSQSSISNFRRKRNIAPYQVRSVNKVVES